MQYELWGRKRSINGVRQQLKFVSSFTKESMFQTMIDSLDPKLYQEGIVLRRNKGKIDRILTYKEYDRPYQYVKIKH